MGPWRADCIAYLLPLRGRENAKMSNPTYNPDDSRVNVIVRLVGILVLALGVGMTFETYQAGAAVLQPPLIPVLYLCSSMLIVAGLVAVVAKYKPSGAPKAQ